MFFSFCWDKTVSCSFLADRFGEETPSEMVFLQRRGLTVPASRTGRRGGTEGKASAPRAAPAPGPGTAGPQLLLIVPCQREESGLCWPGRVSLCLGRDGCDEPWRKHRTAEHGGKLALPDGACALGKRSPGIWWDQRRWRREASSCESAAARLEGSDLRIWTQT